MAAELRTQQGWDTRAFGVADLDQLDDDLLQTQAWSNHVVQLLLGRAVAPLETSPDET